MDALNHAMFAARSASRNQKIEIKSVGNNYSTENTAEIKDLKVKIHLLEQRLKVVERNLHTNGLDEVIPVVRYASLEQIIKVVCRYYNVTHADLCSRRRAKEIARLRLVAYYLCKTHTLRSYPEIGQRFGNKDHTCPLRGYRRIVLLRKSDHALHTQLIELDAIISRLVTPNGKSSTNGMFPHDGAVAGSPLLAAAPEKLK